MTDLNNLLDATLDDLEDLPEFKPFPAGAHKVLATFETKEINGKAAVELNFKYIETLELADPSDVAPKAGDTANTMFMLGNEFGRGAFKKCAVPFGQALNLTNLAEIVEQVTDIECLIITGLRKDKNNPDRVYLQVKELQVV